jgi:hypothetical protein
MAEYIVGIADDSTQDIDRLHREYAVNGMIVRCRDCWKRKFDNCPFYEYSMVVQEDDFFCADGERKSAE